MAREICKEIHNFIVTTELKNDYHLKEQINRASGSIMDNIAEGFERSGTKEFRQFLSISKASCGEVRSQLYRVNDRGYISEQQFELLKSKIILLGKKIGAFIIYLNKSNYSGNKFQ